jgi:hypothetical protein
MRIRIFTYRTVYERNGWQQRLGRLKKATAKIVGSSYLIRFSSYERSTVRKSYKQYCGPKSIGFSGDPDPAFWVNADQESDTGIWWQTGKTFKGWKNTFFICKITICLSLGHHGDGPATGESFSPQKGTSNTPKHEFFTSFRIRPTKLNTNRSWSPTLH